MNMFRKVIILIIIVSTLSIFSCGDEEEVVYTVYIRSTGSGFSGYYIVDGPPLINFSENTLYQEGGVDTTYYLEMLTFTDISTINLDVSTEKSGLTLNVMIWKDDALVLDEKDEATSSEITAGGAVLTLDVDYKVEASSNTNTSTSTETSKKDNIQ